MSDVKDRFRTLDRIPTPDLWRDIERREPADLSLGPSWRRVGVVALALLVAAAGIGLAGWAFLGGKEPRRAIRPAPIAPKANGQIAFVGNKGDLVSFRRETGRVYAVSPDGSQLRLLSRVNGSGLAWSPDGDRLAYLIGGDVSESGLALHVVDADGKHDQLVMKSDQLLNGPPSWSPDGKRIAIAIGGTLYTMNEGGGQVRSITHMMSGNEFRPDWSPDGTKLLFEATEGSPSVRTDLYVIGVDGSRLLRLTSTPQFESWPRWSPDGKWIAFVRHDGQDRPASLQVARTDMSGQRPLFECTCGLMDVAWSPDGTEILFSRFLRSEWHLWTIHMDGSRLHQIKTGSLQACCAAWQSVPTSPPRASSPVAIPSSALPPTPQASSVGDIAYQTGFHAEARIWVMHSDGSDPHRISVGSDPAWSPDGKRIAFRANFGKDGYDIAVANADGSDQRTLVHDASIVRSLEGGAPAWSPDGQTIAFATNEGLFVVPAEGGELRLLADSADCLENDPAWSPDGGRIVFDAGCTEETSDAQAGLIVINADGTGWHRIVGPDGFSSFPPSSPVWSPDGRHIAFDTVQGEGIAGTIYVADADGSNVFALTDGVGPAWSPDGSRIAFAFQDTRFETYSHIYVIGVDGSGLHRLTSVKDRGDGVVRTAALVSNPSWQPTISVP